MSALLEETEMSEPQSTASGRRPRVDTRALSNRAAWRSLALTSALGWGIAGTACAPESEPSVRDPLCAGSGCTPECRDLQVDLCDIRERACQEVIFQSVRCVRGSSLTELPRTDFAPPPSTDPDIVIDAAAPPAPRPAEVAEQVWSQYLDQGLKALHLIEQPLEVAQAEEIKQTGGQASNGDVEILPGNAEQEWWSMKLLAHEYVHTMQDRDYGGIASLYARYSRSSVTAQGIQAFIEGEADMYAWLTHAFMRKAPMDAWGLEEYFAVEEKGKRDDAAKAVSPWTSIRQWHHYPIGARYLYGAWRQGQNIAVRSVLYNLEPDFGRWAADFETPTGPQVSKKPICEPDHTAIIVQDALGPSGVYAILISALRAQKVEVMPAEHMWQVAKDLTEDQIRMYAYTFGTGTTQAQWLDRESRRAMCPVTNTTPTKVNDAGSDAAADVGMTTSDGAAPDGAATTVGAVTLDGATSVSSGAAASSASAATSESIVTAESVSVSSDVGAAGSNVVVPACDAGVIDAGGLPSDAGWFETDDDTTFEELQQHLVPGGPVWASWALGFETKDSATQFTEWVEAANWATLRVEQSGRTVHLFTRSAPASDADERAFDAWTCR